uniref:FMN-binding protein n=2 Tax=Nevskia sp. TaxID=1929292 RepID=UPI004035E151
MTMPIPHDHDCTMPPTGRRSLLRSAAGLFGALLLPKLAVAGDDLWTTFQTPAAFLAEAFGAPPAPSVLVLDAAMQAQIGTVFGRAYPQSQLRYWKANGRSAWILDDIGKQGYQITTSGFVVKDHSIDFARVLIYRESRGEQVAEGSWLKKLSGRKLAGTTLDQNVDNISGATLSVKMMQRMAATALVLDTLAKA